MNFPENLKYTNEHIWVRFEGDEAFLGVTEFAQSELGDIVYVEVETEGEVVEKDAVFGTIEAVKTVSDLFMPFTGEVVAFNTELEDEPELVNTDPYGKGWIVKVVPNQPISEENLLTASAYETLVLG